MNENESKYKVTQVNLLLRLAIAGYEEYLLYSLVQSYMEGEGLALPVMIIVVLVFGVGGLLLAIFSIKSLILGEYSGGKADKAGHTEDNSEEKTDYNTEENKDNKIE